MSAALTTASTTATSTSARWARSLVATSPVTGSESAIKKGIAVRVTGDPEPYFASAARKYRSRLGDGPIDIPPDVWLFRIEPREG